MTCPGPCGTPSDPRSAITSLALAAIDTALWDLRCLKAGRPLWQLAGGAKPGVSLYSTEGGWLHLETHELIADAIEVQNRGFRGAKVKIGKPKAGDDRERLTALREAVGEGFDIMVDANQCFSLPGAMRRVAALEEADIAWFEEPLPADDIDVHRRLAQQCAVPIAVGESLYSLAQFKDYLQAGACSIVQADVARVGGITPWLKVAHLAEAYNVPICPHFLMELHVSLCCAVTNSPWLEYIPQLDAITSSRLQIENGYAVAPMAPGLGIDWDWAAVTAHTVGSPVVIDS
ncbi:MAG: mandelate racemase/muconate lactonizing enzyme family protein [Pseudomonadota bacterium]